MPNTKISNLTSAGTLTGSEVAPIVQSSNTVKVSTQNIADLAPVPNATKIAALTNAGALTGTENVIITQSGTTVKTTTQAIANLGGGPSPKLFNGAVQVSFGTPTLTTYSNSFTALTATIVSGNLRINCSQFTGAELVSFGCVINSTDIGTGISRLIYGTYLGYSSSIYTIQFVTAAGAAVNLSNEDFNNIFLVSIYKS